MARRTEDKVMFCSRIVLKVNLTPTDPNTREIKTPSSISLDNPDAIRYSSFKLLIAVSLDILES